MKSVIAALVVALALGISASTAMAMTAGDVPHSGGTESASLGSSTTAPPVDGGLGTLAIVLIATGGALTLAGAAWVGVHYMHRPQHAHPPV